MTEKKSAKLTRSPSGGRLKSTNLPDLYSFESTPSDLKRQKASVKTLIRHGLPVRPRGKGSETGAQLWDSMMSRRFRHIHPHLRVTSTSHPPPPTHTKSRKKARIAEGEPDFSFGGAKWSGGVVRAPMPGLPPHNNTRRLVAACSSWVIPTVRRPDGAQDYDSPWWSGAWVGLDGYFGSKDVLQAGTAHVVTAGDDSDEVNYYAWFEWYPNAEVAIDNFPVAPGDSMFVYVRFEGPDALQVDYGSAWLVNRTTEIETSAVFPAPSIGFQGISAECVMEQPSQMLADGTNDIPYNFVHYGEVAFTNFGVCGEGGTFFGAKDIAPLRLDSGMSDGQYSQDIVCRPEA